MSQHILQLSFPDSANEGVLLIDDISIYDSQTNAINNLNPSGQCTLLQITPPGYVTPTVINVTQGFRVILTACSLGITLPQNCITECPDLPDGMYNIRYSVPPSNIVFVEYKIMRITEALNRYYKMLCKVDLKQCVPDKDTEQQLKYLDIIHNYLLSSKITVENMHRFSEGMEQYRYAVYLMDKMSYGPQKC